ncbi:MAG: hypothetical protein M3521_07705 [Acidobacteriota bacterium]|jgi:hypothetical protein|nr:hypothetical protein [Acidobacteriota bacterium]MDQ3373755.1 hypothetical protein [Acidobacteriota bacterium]
MMKTNSIFKRNFCGRRAVAKTFCLSLSAFCVLFFAGNISAQQNNSKRRTKTKVSQVQPKVVISTSDKTANAVTLVNRVEADYLSGEASVSVNPKQPTVIRLGLAQNATSVVEFPSIDQIYYIHEGNPKLVTIFQSPTKETDRSVTLYPGEGFLPTSVAGQKELSVTITMQMKSGLVIVLEIVPAPDIRQNAHRCVLNYNLAEVVAARRAAGLKVNLGDEVAPKQVKPTRAVSSLMTANLSKESDSIVSDNTGNVSPVSVVEIAVGGSGKTESDSSKRKMKTGTQLSRVVNKKLAEAIKSPKEKFTVWSPATKGLSLSTAKVVEIDDFQRLLIVAVKNETTDALRLLDEMPELQIQTVDKSGNSLQLERLTRKYTETTALAGAIPAGAIVYYAVVYENPVLGANQKLLVSAAHDRAADAPVVASTANQLDNKENR